MKYLKTIFAICLSAILLTGCENDGFFYQDVARIRLAGPEIWALNTDSLEFSFLPYANSVTEMQMDVDACLIGETANYDRTINLKINSEKTTATSSQYSLPTSITLPAGKNKVSFPVILKRDASLQQKSIRLYVEVAESGDFKIGDNEGNHILIKWNDILSMPKNWSDIQEFFGAYSDVKYRFMLSNSGGVTSFDAEEMSWAQLQSLKIKFQNALNEYNEAHPGQPLSDKDGILITF